LFVIKQGALFGVVIVFESTILPN